jgi:hypothetical protein
VDAGIYKRSTSSSSDDEEEVVDPVVEEEVTEEVEEVEEVILEEEEELPVFVKETTLDEDVEDEEVTDDTPKDIVFTPTKEVKEIKVTKEPEHGTIEIIDGLNKSVDVAQGIVSLRNDRGTTYGRYIAVQNELVAAYNELRKEAAYEYFGKRSFDELDDNQQKIVKQIYPQRISEAEPKNIGGK